MPEFKLVTRALDPQANYFLAFFLEPLIFHRTMANCLLGRRLVSQATSGPQVAPTLRAPGSRFYYYPENRDCDESSTQTGNHDNSGPSALHHDPLSSL